MSGLINEVVVVCIDDESQVNNKVVVSVAAMFVCLGCSLVELWSVLISSGVGRMQYQCLLCFGIMIHEIVTGHFSICFNLT